MYKLYQEKDNKQLWYVVNEDNEAVNFTPTTENTANLLLDALNENLMLKGNFKEYKKGTVLTEANELIYGDRAAAYGPVTTSFERIGKFWETILGVPVTAEQVGLCMIALKISRQISRSGRDNIVDIAGYAGCIAKMDEEKAAKQ